MSTLDPRTRMLRAISGIARASRDADALGENLTGHLGFVVWEIAVELAYLLRRLAYVARAAGVPDEAITSAKKMAA